VNDYAWLAAFRKGMADLRHSEGQDYVIDARFGDGMQKVLVSRIDDLVSLKPDVILTPGDGTLPPLLARTKNIPIVFATPSDPVRMGFVNSLHRPGGNATGLSSQAADLGSKRMQLLKEAFPGVTHVALLYEPQHPSGPSQVEELERAAAQIKLRSTRIELRQPTDIESAFQHIAKVGAQASLNTRGVLVTNHRKAVLEQIVQHRLPAMFDSSAYADAGGLMSYGIATEDNFRRAAAYVSKILKGASPAELPIEQPTKFELVINLRTARALDFAIPASLLARADRVIQ
jgi:putative ABC transport system substrate-binding protein